MSMGNKGIKFKDHEGNGVYPCPYYPVGSIYMSVNNINPSEFFGGIWEQIEDRFLLACGSSYKAGTTGGSNTKKLQIKNMPSNVIVSSSNGVDKTWCTGHWDNYSNFAYPTQVIQSTSIKGNEAFDIMPPYLAIYVWTRTA